jgi:hypothetical protein
VPGDIKVAREIPIPRPLSFAHEIVWVNADDHGPASAARDADIAKAKAVFNSRVFPLKISGAVGAPPSVRRFKKAFTAESMIDEGFAYDTNAASDEIDMHFLRYADTRYERWEFYGLEPKDMGFWRPSAYKAWRTGLNQVAAKHPDKPLYAGMVACNIRGQQTDDGFVGVTLSPKMRVNEDGEPIDTWDGCAVWESALPILKTRRDHTEMLGCKDFRHALLVVYVPIAE